MEMHIASMHYGDHGVFLRAGMAVCLGRVRAVTLSFFFIQSSTNTVMKSSKHSNHIFGGSDFLHIRAKTDPFCSFRKWCPNLRGQSAGGSGVLIIGMSFAFPSWDAAFTPC